MNEGSRFIRYYIQKWQTNINSIVIKNENDKEEKRLEIFNSSSPVAQIKYVSEELQKLTNEEVKSTLIVLSDENLLTPFLNSVPHNIQKLNVTMGYSIKKSGFYALLNGLFQLVEKTNNDKVYYKFLVSFFSSLKSMEVFKEDVIAIEDKLKSEGEIYMDKNAFDQQNQFHSYLNTLIFEESIQKFYEALISFLDFVYPEKQSIDDISYQKFRKELIRLKRIVFDEKELAGNITKEFLIKIIRQVSMSLKVPFEGEPVEGLQVMGPLEIRVLDFERVFMLSMNDGVYPKNSLRTSLLPYSLRKAFGLPTFETQESIYAHHFYALFQNAKNIQTHYSIREGGVGESEKSRFLTQLHYEADQYSSLNIEEKIISYELNSANIDVSGFRNSEEKINELIEKYSKGESYFSPTALGTFLECNLKFYYKYFLKIYEKEDVKEELESVDIGNIIHKALELIFIDYREITLEILNKITAKVDQYILKSLEECELIINNKGYNYFMIEASKNYLKSYIKNLSKYAPFKVVYTEELLIKEVKIGDNLVKIGGNLDLVISSKNNIYIIDFKTGRVKTLEPKNEDLVELKLNQKKYKHYFQLLFYYFLYQAKKGNL